MIDSSSRLTTLVAVVAAFLFFVGLGTADLRGSTEPREAGVAAEMLQDKNFVTPKLNGENFLEKPPLSYWLQAASIRTFGYTNWAPRVPSAVAAFCTVMLLFVYVTAKENDPRAGTIAALALATMASFWMNARTAGQDVLLVFGITLALISFLQAHASGKMRHWLGYVVGLALATSAKGVIGLAIPGATIFSFLLLDHFRSNRIRSDNSVAWLRAWLMPAAFAVLALLPLCIWLFVLDRREGLAAVREIVLVNSVGRFAGEYTRGAHNEPFYYYLAKLPEAFEPWTLPLLFVLWRFRKRLLDRDILFYLCWLVGPFLLLSISSSKRPTYLLALYPAAALLLTTAIWRSRQMLFDRYPAWQRHFAVVAGGLMIAYTIYGFTGLPHKAARESARQMYEQLPRADKDPNGIILYKPSERISGAARFYARGPVAVANARSELDRLSRQYPAAKILIADSDSRELVGWPVLHAFQYGKEKYQIVATRGSTR